MPAGIRQIKDAPSWPHQEAEEKDSSVVSTVKKIGIFLGAAVATIAIITALGTFYKSFVADIKDEARAEQRATQIEKRVDSLDTKLGEVNGKIDDISKRQQLDQVRGARVETLLEILLKSQGQTLPPKSQELTTLQRANGEY